jgi:hypothetical protein
MKRTFTLAIALLISFASIGQGEQFTLLSKQTADWCPRCGQWGWTFVKDALVELEDENVIFWGLHFDGGLATETSKTIVQNFDTGYQPVFFLNQDDLNVSSSNIAAKVAEAKQTIQLLNSFPGIINVNVNPTLSGNTINAKVDVNFSEGTETDYNLGVYLVRDNVVAYQASQGNNAVHPNLLDASFNSDAWGPIINDGNSITAGDVFSSEFTLTDVSNHSSDIKDLKVVVVVWFNTGTEYTFVNGDIKSVQLASSSENLTNFDFDYIINQNSIQINVTETLSSNAQLNLFTLEGRAISLNNIDIKGSTIKAEIPGLNSGAYIINLMDNNKQGSKKIYIVD